MQAMLSQASCEHQASHSAALSTIFTTPLATWEPNVSSILSNKPTTCCLSPNWYCHPALLAYTLSSTVLLLAVDQLHAQPPQGRPFIQMSVDCFLHNSSLGSVILSHSLTIIHTLQLCFPLGKRVKCLRNLKNFISHFPPHCKCRCCTQITVVSTLVKCFSTTCASMVLSTHPHHPIPQSTMGWLNTTTTQSWR